MRRAKPLHLLTCSAAEPPVHEVSIAQSIVEAVLLEMENRGRARVVVVHTAVGGLTHVEPENLKFWYEELTRDTPLAGSELEVVKQPVVVRCRQCGQEFEVVANSFVCPGCGIADVRLTGGDELVLESIEVEE